MAGLANSFLDSGTYPALMESFPHSASRANVLIKAFVSAGQFLLPFIISFLIWANLWFGWSFVIAAALFVLSGIYLLKMPFPDSQAAKKEESPEPQAETFARPQANKLDMMIFTLYGYIGMATFYLVSQWLAQYGQFVVGLPYASAIKLLSIYIVGLRLRDCCLRQRGVQLCRRHDHLYWPVDGLAAAGVPVPDADDGYRLRLCHRLCRRGRSATAGSDDHGDELPERKRQSNRHLLHRRQYRQLHDPVDHRKAFADQYCQHYVV